MCCPKKKVTLLPLGLLPFVSMVFLTLNSFLIFLVRSEAGRPRVVSCWLFSGFWRSTVLLFCLPVGRSRFFGLPTILLLPSFWGRAVGSWLSCFRFCVFFILPAVVLWMRMPRLLGFSLSPSRTIVLKWMPLLLLGMMSGPTLPLQFLLCPKSSGRSLYSFDSFVALLSFLDFCFSQWEALCPKSSGRSLCSFDSFVALRSFLDFCFSQWEASRVPVPFHGGGVSVDSLLGPVQAGRYWGQVGEVFGLEGLLSWGFGHRVQGWFRSVHLPLLRQTL
jgi:hypothetical protein